MKLACASLLFTGSARAADAPGFDQVLAGAIREGKLNVAMQAPAKPATQRALVAAFNERLKTNIRVEWVTAPAPITNTRAIAEMAGGKVSVDVIGVGAAEEVAVGRQVRPSEALPVEPGVRRHLPQVPALEKLMIPEFKGDALPYLIASYGLAWNPAMLKDQDVPERLTDLLDAKWARQDGDELVLSDPARRRQLRDGPAADAGFCQEADRQRAGVPARHAGRGARGDHRRGAVRHHRLAGCRAEHPRREPLKFKLFADYIPVSQLHIYVPEGAPDPNAARLFAAWLVSDGVKLADKYEPLSSQSIPTVAWSR